MHEGPTHSTLATEEPLRYYYGPDPDFRKRGFAFRPKAGQDLKSISWRVKWSPKDWDDYILVNVRKWTDTLPKAKPCIDNYRFTPQVEDPTDFAFILFGDTGQNTPGQYLTTTAMSDMKTYPSDFALILGDVVYPAGDADDYEYGFFEAYRHYPRPIYAVPGNHDWYDRLIGFDQFFVSGNSHKTFPQYGRECPHLPNWFYYMDFPGLRIICIDSGISGTMSENREVQLPWLEGLLETKGDRKVVLFMHHPPFSLVERGDETVLRELIVPLLEKYGVAAVFSGHHHNYQHHYIHNTHYIIAGAGGSTLTPLPRKREIETSSIQQPVMTLCRPLNRCWDQVQSFLYCHYKEGALRVECWSPDVPADRFLLDVFEI